MTTISGNKELDLEWIELIKQAQEIGISFEEIRSFLHNATTAEYTDK
ncbi:anti-repressor SinI family protein [Neobacillus niacini]